MTTMTTIMMVAMVAMVVVPRLVGFNRDLIDQGAEMANKR